MSKLEGELKRLRRRGEVQRRARRRSQLPAVTLVGYTNAGKSTLLNRVTSAQVLVEDRLFSTLDPTTRRLSLPGGEVVLLSDTVGFVRKLPHQLVEAFQSTLQEVTDADLLIHVVDATSEDPRGQIDAVRAVLEEIGAGSVPELLVFNKGDANPGVAKLVDDHRGAVAVSAVTGEGVDTLLQVLGDRLRSLAEIVELVVPYERGDVIAALHRSGDVLVESHEESGARLRVRLGPADTGRFNEWRAAL
jgi:GTP-binding protein HflX